MSPWLIGLAAVVALFGLAVALEIYLRRNQPRRPLAERMLRDAADADPMGYEGLDMGVVNRMLRRMEQGGAMDTRITRTHLVRKAASDADHAAIFVPERAKRKDRT
ncbi:MAG: hypothetical protein AAFQ51_18640 [Pseudomonadota bacterium]